MINTTAKSGWGASKTILFLLAFFSFLSVPKIMTDSGVNYVNLARSFYEGKLYTEAYEHHGSIMPANTGDASLYNGRYYYPKGPLVPLLIAPFTPIIFNSDYKFAPLFVIAYLMLIVHILVGLLTYVISRKLTLSRNNSLWMVFGFMFASVYIGMGLHSIESHLTHIVTSMLLLASFYEYITYRRWWMIGTYIGLSFLNRVPSIFPILFYILVVFFDDGAIKVVGMRDKINAIIQLSIPTLCAIGICFAYNYLRFDSILEFGYRYQIMDGYLKARRDIGLTSVRHIVYNIYYGFLATPMFIGISDGAVRYPYVQAHPWGMSLLLTSPYLITLRKSKWSDSRVKFLFIASFVTLLYLLLLFSPGMAQYGYRFALDFFAFIYIIFIYAISKHWIVLTPGLKIAIVVTAVFNFWLTYHLFYPLSVS